MSDTLAEICAAKRTHIAKRKAEFPENRLLKIIDKAEAPRGFIRQLQVKADREQIGLIAEIKKASPSGGLIRSDFNPSSLAMFYEQGGATCLSILTDEPYFQGNDKYLQEAKLVSSLPVLRKDFILDAYQVYESRALGADCILLIMAALDDSTVRELEALAIALGMDVLIEVHNEQELKRALAINPLTTRKIIGINNRDLKTLKVDLSTSETLAKQIPNNILKVCESGIRTNEDIKRLHKSGFSCFLVGESLMREDNVELATRRLLRMD